MLWRTVLASLFMVLGVVFLAFTDEPPGPPDGQPYEGPQSIEQLDYTLFVGKWGHTCITYHADDPELASLANQSLNDVWGSVSPIRSCGQVASGEDVTIVAVATGALGSGVLGQAGCSASGGFITHCQISIAGNGRFLGVEAHEFGHALGLGHSQRSDQLMSAFCCHELGADDIAGIQFLYGPGTGVTPQPTSTGIPPTATAGGPCVGLACVTRTPTPSPLQRRAILPGVARD